MLDLLQRGRDEARILKPGSGTLRLDLGLEPGSAFVEGTGAYRLSPGWAAFVKGQGGYSWLRGRPVVGVGAGVEYRW